MNLTHLGLVDLVLGLLVLGSVLGAFRRRAGLFGALASGVGTAVVLWLVAGALLVWATPTVGSVVGHSALLDLVPPPTGALRQLGELVGQAWSRTGSAA